MSAFQRGRVFEPEDGHWERILERSLKSTGRPARNKIYGSSAGLCERQTAGLILLPKGVTEERNAATQFYFSIGNAFEQVVERALKADGSWLASEMIVKLPVGEYEVSGRIDFVVQGDERPLLVELKTCGKVPEKPRPYQLAQLHTYLLVTGFPSGLLWYISRSVAGWSGTIQQRVFEVTPTEQELKVAANSIAVGAAYAAAERLPARPDRMRKYKCGFCPLIPHCWDDEKLVDVPQATPAERIALQETARDLFNELMDGREARRELFMETLAED